jgi:AcrR family transcriptional regulator
MAPDERRAALVEATLPLLYEHGRAVSTRLIAEAAGVAEGTIFRVFATKEELIDAAILKAFEPGRMAAVIAAIDEDAPLRDRAVALVRGMQKSFARIFLLMHKLGMTGPPETMTPDDPNRAKVIAASMQSMVDLIRPDQDQLTMPAASVVQMLRLLTFSGTHPKFAGSDILTPEQIVDTVLYGAVRRPDDHEGS